MGIRLVAGGLRPAMGASLPGQAVVLCLLSLGDQTPAEVRVRIPPSFWRAHKLGGILTRGGILRRDPPDV